MKPVKRSNMRIKLGKLYFTMKRYLEWYFGKKAYASNIMKAHLDHLVFSHKTPLLRELKNVDMWMQHNKIENLKIAIKNLNGIVLQPGETFSYWRLIGNPTATKGYKEGMVLSYGEVKKGVGGGLCQLSNLIYWMTLHTPLTVTERYRHSYDVFPDSNRKLPFGSGATCSYNYLDLQINNDTAYPYQLILYLTENDLVGEWRSAIKENHHYEVYEDKHWFSHEYWGGYVRHNILRRRVFSNTDELIDDQYITENHAIMMYHPYLSDGRQQGQ